MQYAFSNSDINKVAMVKNALLPMSLYSLLWVNEIIRYHLHRADLSLSKKLCKSYKGGRFGLLKSNIGTFEQIFARIWRK